MQPYLRYAAEKQRDILALIRAFVQCESPSNAPAEVARFVDLMIEQTRDIASSKVIRAGSFGPHVRLQFKLPRVKKKRQNSKGQILALGHADTVWPLGALRDMPFRQTDGRLWGPGVLDMKSGLAFWIFAMRALRDLDIAVEQDVVLLVVSDEEVGSVSSRTYTEMEAQRSSRVLVLEPGTGLSGKLKTARKGVANYSLEVDGKAAHAGVDFPNGASAIQELARQIDRIAAFTNLRRGITVNPGLISGGTRANVVAAKACVDIDVRVVRLRDAAALDKKLRALRPFDKRCKLRVDGGLNRPPMERSKAIAALFAQAKQIAAAMGIAIEESSTGGGSDGNFTAALGVPTLDGLGGVGEGAHAPNESILLDRIADRVALLAGLVACQ